MIYDTRKSHILNSIIVLPLSLLVLIDFSTLAVIVHLLLDWYVVLAAYYFPY